VSFRAHASRPAPERTGSNHLPGRFSKEDCDVRAQAGDLLSLREEDGSDPDAQVHHHERAVVLPEPPGMQAQGKMEHHLAQEMITAAD